MTLWRRLKRLPRLFGPHRVFVLLAGLLTLLGVLLFLGLSLTCYPFVNTPTSVLRSLTLTLDLPALMPPSVLTALYNHQLRGQLTPDPHEVRGAAEYEHRRDHLKTACDKLGENLQGADLNAIKKMWFSPEPFLMYCPVYKVGTTFWSKVFEVMRYHQLGVTSPFQIFDQNGLQDYLKMNMTIFETNSTIDINEILTWPVKFMFARNPYQRIFSVYVDKVLAPNPYFWGYGARAISKFRIQNVSSSDQKSEFSVLENQTRVGNASFQFVNTFVARNLSSNHVSCGYDVTFKEFVQYLLIIQPEHLDRHLLPISTTCDVCNIDYNVIGKLETFDQDVMYMLKRSNLWGKYISFSNMNIERVLDTLLYQVIRAFSLEHSWSQCIDKHTAMIRLWRQLQISGYIDKDYPYPYQQSESATLTTNEYINLAIKAFQRSSSEARHNKEAAFLLAYSQLSKEDLEGIRSLYLKDFYLFEYADRPKELFEMDRNEFKEAFDYFDVLKYQGG